MALRATDLVHLATPVTSMARRHVRGEYWTEIETHLPDAGPQVAMSQRSDVQSPDDGTGALVDRRYLIFIADSLVGPAELLDRFRLNPNHFSPAFAVFDAPDGPPDSKPVLREGEKVVVRLPGPWDGPCLVTGVDATSLRLETLSGHMEAGRIEFSTSAVGEEVIFEIDSLARSGDLAFDALYRSRLAKLVQTEMWIRVLESAAASSGGRPQGRPIVETVFHHGAER